MKHALIVVTLLVSSSARAQPTEWVRDVDSASEALGLKQHTFESRVVGGPVGYLLYLPPGYAENSAERYPVMYWLHGLGGSPASAGRLAKRMPAAIESGASPPFIIVGCTDPTKATMWTDSKDGNVPVETVIVRELIAHIDASYRTVADRDARAIAGFSMGGFGAAYLGFKYPETFGAISMLSGALHTAESLKTNRLSIFDAVYAGDMDDAKARSPWNVVAESAETVRARSTVQMFIGSEDGLLERNQRYHELLTELGIEHEWGVVPDAPHNLETVLENWPGGDPFAFYAKAFGVLVSN